MHNRALLGQQAENQVAQYLEREGFSILEQNYRITGGEIDLIAKSKTHILFIEVKMRQHIFFDLTQVINLSKQRKIIRAAQTFIARNGAQYLDKIYRFDVALVHDDKGTSKITYIPNAFTTGGAGHDYAY